jgi:2-methylcitrate dehydratase PrpD
MSPIKTAGPVQIHRRDFLSAAAVGLAFGTSSLDAMGQETTEKGQASVGEIVAGYAANLRYEDLPNDVIRLAKRAILDTFGCAFSGYTAEPSKIAMKLASNASAQQPATVLFAGIKTTPDLAVFANGVMIRYLDFNDAFVSQTNGAGHPSDMIAALLTAAELKQRSGRDLIMATVLAYEVFCKIADVFDYLGNGIDHSTITGMGAVVGAGRLMGLTPEQMVHAIGITVGGNTATRQGRADELSNWKAYAAPQTHETADHSIPYAAGLVLRYGKIEPEYYDDPYLHDRALLDLVRRIKCLPSDAAETPELSNLCELEIVLKTGARKTFRVEYHRGHYKNPMTDAEMEEKFRLLAQKHLSPDRVDALVRRLWQIESEPRVSGLITATQV